MSYSHKIKVFFLTWFAMIGVDFFLHAGLLAFLYVEPHPFLLTPQQAFKFIPIGYLSFGIQAFILIWLIEKLSIKTFLMGAWFGLRLGAIIWGSLILGLFSIATAPLPLLIGWFIGQSIEMMLGGAIATNGLQSEQLRSLTFRVFLLVIALVIITIIMQNIGLAPAIRIDG